MKSFSIMPMTCEMNATRYSIAESRFVFQTARRNLSSFILKSCHCEPEGRSYLLLNGKAQSSSLCRLNGDCFGRCRSLATLAPACKCRCDIPLASIHRKIRDTSSICNDKSHAQRDDPYQLKCYHARK